MPEEFDLEFIEGLIDKMPEEIQEGLHDILDDLVYYRTFVDDLPAFWRVWIANKFGHQIVKLFKMCNLATNDVRGYIVQIVSWAFVLEGYHPAWETGPSS